MSCDRLFVVMTLLCEGEERGGGTTYNVAAREMSNQHDEHKESVTKRGKHFRETCSVEVQAYH